MRPSSASGGASLSSATMMPNMPAFERAAVFAREHPEFSYGLHLCLTDERPVSDPAAIPTLVAPDGCFWKTAEFFKRALTGRIAGADIRRETLAQLTRMQERGIAVRHLDAHGHVHKAAVVPCALRRVLGASGIATVRRTQNLFYKRPRFSRRCFNLLANTFIRLLGRTTDYFLMVAGTLGEGDTAGGNAASSGSPKESRRSASIPAGMSPGAGSTPMPVLERGRRYLEDAGVQLISFHELP